MHNSFFAAFRCRVNYSHVFTNKVDYKTEQRIFIVSRTSSRNELLTIGDAGVCPDSLSRAPSELNYDRVFVAELIDVISAETEIYLFQPKPSAELSVNSRFLPTTGYCKLTFAPKSLNISGHLMHLSDDVEDGEKGLRFHAQYLPWDNELLQPMTDVK